MSKCKVCKNEYKKTTSMYGKIWEDCVTCGKTKEQIEKESEPKELKYTKDDVQLDFDFDDWVD